MNLQSNIYYRFGEDKTGETRSQFNEVRLDLTFMFLFMLVASLVSFSFF